MSSLVKTLEEKLLPGFQALAKRLTAEFPNVSARAYSYPVGSLSDYQGYSFCVDCILTDAADDETDNVCLSVTLAYLTSSPQISADVCWGHPNACLEADFVADWQSSSDWKPEVSEEILSQLYADIPRLSNALYEAVRRRRPRE